MQDFNEINAELDAYGHGLQSRPQIVVANKTEMPGTEDNVLRLQDTVNARVKSEVNTDREGLTDPQVYAISAATGDGLDKLNFVIAERVQELRQAAEDTNNKDSEYDKI